MAKISTYNNANPITLSDKVIGTSVGATPANATKNFLVSDMIALFADNITLQDVLDAGNTATQDINLTGNISLVGGELNLDAASTLAIGGIVRDSAGATGLLGQTLTADASGNVVWGSGGGGSQNLEQVLAIGNTATNNINLTGDILQSGRYELTGDFTQTSGDYNLTGDFTHTGDYEITGNITQTGGDYNLTGNIIQTGNTTQTGDTNQTGDITHAGLYNYSSGQFNMAASATMLLNGELTCDNVIALTGTVKDSTSTLGSDGEALISNASGEVTWQDVSTLPSIVRATGSTSFTLTLINQGGVLLTTSALATDVIVPANATTAFPVGTKIIVIQEGSGAVTVSGAVGVTLRSAQSHDKLSHQYSVAELVKTDTDIWYLYGDIKA